MRRLPFPVRIAAGVALAALVVHGAAWWWLSRQVQAGFDAWVATRRALGWTVASAAPSLGGWPTAGGIAMPDLVVTGPGWRWTADRLAVTVRFWAPGQVRLAPSGNQSFTAGPFNGRLAAQSMAVTLDLPGGGNPVLHARGLSLDAPFGSLAVDGVDGSILADGGAVRLSAEVAGVTLPPGQPYVLGRAITRARIDASTAGGLPAPETAALATWRASGGTVRLDRVQLGWGGLTLDGTGTATLDAGLQPVADLRVAMTGQDAALDAAAAQGLIQPRTTLAIRAVLGLLARSSPGDSSLPVSLRNGAVAVAGFPVARVPAIGWPP